MLLKRIGERLKNNLGDVPVIMMNKRACLMIHYRCNEDPMIEIPERNDDYEEEWMGNEFDSSPNHNRMMPYHVDLDDNGGFDVEHHLPIILERLKDAIAPETV